MNIKSKPIARIGFAAPLTGDQAVVGIPMRQCAEIAIRRANSHLDIPFHIVLEAQDDAAEPGEARNVARCFVKDDSVFGMVGHKNSGPSAAAAPIYAEADLSQVSPSSTNPILTRQGHHTFFRLCAHDDLQGKLAAQFGARCLFTKRVAIIHDQTDYGAPLAEVVRDTFREEGTEIILFEGVNVGDTDFNSIVQDVMEKEPDLVYFALTEIESSIITKQLRSRGVTSHFLGTDGGHASKFLPLAGGDAEGVYQTYAGVDPVGIPAAHAFVEEFQSTEGLVPVYGAEVFDATNLLIRALSEVGSLDRSKILKVVSDTDAFDGVTGSIRFHTNGERWHPEVSVWRVEHGKIKHMGSLPEMIEAQEK